MTDLPPKGEGASAAADGKPLGSHLFGRSLMSSRREAVAIFANRRALSQILLNRMKIARAARVRQALR